MLGQGSPDSTKASSLHSDPDPADEDCIPSRIASNDPSTRPGLQNMRLPSYTNFLSSRTFSPEVKPENKWKLHWTQSDSPSVRAASEATSNNEDWRTALNSSTHSQSDLSRNGSRQTNGRKTDRDQGRNSSRSPRLQHLQKARGSPSTRSIRSDSDRNVAVHETDANGQRTKAQQETTSTDEHRTPQARRKSSRGSLEYSATADVLSELSDLKRRINELELSPAPLMRTPSEKAYSIRSIDRKRPHTDQDLRHQYARSLAGNETDVGKSHAHPLLRTSIHSIRESNLPGELVRPLDLAVSDALALSTISLDRVSRGRVDGLCRSLTSVCLYLQKQDDFSTIGPISPASRARSNSIDSGHNRKHSVDSSAGVIRSRSIRRSLAEILRSPPENNTARSASSVASASDLSSRHTRSRDYHGSGYNGSIAGVPARASSSRLSMHSRTATDGQYTRANHAVTTTHYHNGSLHAREGSSSRSIYSKSRQRVPELADILNRSPVTREALYAKYHRDSPNHD